MLARDAGRRRRHCCAPPRRRASLPVFYPRPLPTTSAQCGKGPFAVLTAWKTAENQTIPADIAQQIQAHDDGTLPMVYSATLSFDFSLASTA
jgi:hypothetical protein